MVLYADVLFAINFSMDFLALFITTRIMHKRLYKVRILISALIGGIYSIIEMVITIQNVSLQIGINILVSLIMCIIAFKERKFGRFAVIYAIFWGVSALMGGVMSLLFSTFNKIFYTYIAQLDIIDTSSYNGTRFVVIILASIIVSILLSKLYTTKKCIQNVNLKIWVDTSVFDITGLCDSGNLLVEPLSGKNVILVSSSSKLGKKIEEEPEYKKRYIPYSGVEASGILKGIIPTKIIINDIEVDAIIAPIRKNDFGGFEALVPYALT